MIKTIDLNREARRNLARKLGVDLADLTKVYNRAAPTVDDAEDVTIPETSTELEGMLGDPKTMRKLFAKPELFRNFIAAYARNALDGQADIARQVQEQVQVGIAQFLKEARAGGGSPVDLNMANPTALMYGDGAQQSSWARLAQRQGLNNPRAMGAAVNKEFANSADFFNAIWHQRQDRDAQLQAKLQRVRNSFSSTVPSEGGFLIPENLRSELLRVSLETAVVRPRARVIPMESLTVPFPAIDSTSNVSSVYGGVVAYWTEEGAALVESQAAFGRIVLTAKKLTAYTEVPNELISDSLISFQAFLDMIFPEALGFYEDDAFLNGNGVGMPLGILNSGNSALIEVAKEATQSADTIVWENVLKMYSRMLPGSLNRAVWLVSPDTFPELATMALTVGTGGSAVWLTNGTADPILSLLGRPVIVTEKASKLGDRGDINFVDFGFYLIGDRQVMSAMSSPHFKFANDRTAYRIIERVDGKPWLQSAITPKNNGPTLSPFVNLAERA